MEASEEGTAAIVRGRALPLISRRLTKAHLQALAQGLELSSTAEAEELRLMIEGMLLREIGKDPMSVQVMCNEADESGDFLNVDDESGVLLNVDHYRQDNEEPGLEDAESVVLSGEPSSIEEALDET